MTDVVDEQKIKISIRQNDEYGTLMKMNILEWCSYCTAHGISNISRTKDRTILTVWLLCYFASIGYCCY